MEEVADKKESRSRKRRRMTEGCVEQEKRTRRRLVKKEVTLANRIVCALALLCMHTHTHTSKNNTGKGVKMSLPLFELRKLFKCVC